MGTRYRKAFWLALLAATPLLSGCGTDALAGGFDGEVRTVATSSPEGGGANDEAGAAPARYSRAPSAAAEGTVSFDAAVALVSSDGEEVRITKGTVPAVVAIDGSDSSLLGEARVPAGSYARARVTFTRVSADITGGLVVGGLPLLGEVRVQIGAGERLVVERPITLTVAPESQETVIVDLNARAWLDSVINVGLPGQTPLVPAAEFTSAVAVRVAP
jgi:hypothetical protein